MSFLLSSFLKTTFFAVWHLLTKFQDGPLSFSPRINLIKWREVFERRPVTELVLVLCLNHGCALSPQSPHWNEIVSMSDSNTFLHKMRQSKCVPVWKTSTTPSYCILSRTQLSVMNTPVRPTPALKKNHNACDQLHNLNICLQHVWIVLSLWPALMLVFK